jgi:protease-4
VASGLLGKIKINPVTVERGARANLLDPRKPPSYDELAVLQDQLHNFYDEFKNRVEEGRKLRPETLEEIAGGRVWTGAEALEKNLVDEIGGFRTALERARELAGISDGSPGVFVKVPPPAGFRPAPGEPVREAVEALRDALSELGAARLWALAPYEISHDW